MICCDVCRKPCNNEKFIVPTYSRYEAMGNGVKLIEFDKLEKKEINLCDECRSALAYILKTMQVEFD